jgi:hypothetical protein
LFFAFSCSTYIFLFHIFLLMIHKHPYLFIVFLLAPRAMNALCRPPPPPQQLS